MSYKAASVYAKTFFNLSKKENAVEKHLEDFVLLSAALKENKTALNFLNIPKSSLSDQKEKLVDELSKNLSPSFSVWLKVLLRRKRFHLIFSIYKIYKALHEQEQGIVEAKVFSSAPLEESQKQNLKEKLVKFINKEISMSYEVKKDLGYGVQIKLGNYLIDDSLKAHLSKLKTNILNN